MDLLTSDTSLVAGSKGNPNSAEVREIIEDKRRGATTSVVRGEQGVEMLDIAKTE